MGVLECDDGPFNGTFGGAELITRVTINLGNGDQLTTCQRSSNGKIVELSGGFEGWVGERSSTWGSVMQEGG